MDSFRLRANRDGPISDIDPDAKRIVDVLKEFVWEYIIENPDLAVLQNGQRAAVRNVFTQLLDASRRKTYFLFPAAHQGAIKKARTKSERVRVVADCIAGMTEKEIMRFHRSLQGLGA